MAQYDLKNSDIIKGGHLMILVDDGGVKKPIAFATSHSLSKTLNTNEIATKDHGDYAAVLPQTISWEASTENLYAVGSTGCPGYKKLNEIFNKRKDVEIYFGETTYGVTGIEYITQPSIVGVTGADNWTQMPNGFGEKGKALITSLQVTAGAGDNATFTATFTGSGDLNVVTTTPEGE